jgi:hypothetical protein
MSAVREFRAQMLLLSRFIIWDIASCEPIGNRCKLPDAPQKQTRKLIQTPKEKKRLLGLQWPNAEEYMNPVARPSSTPGV